jgi:hypothetical protein
MKSEDAMNRDAEQDDQLDQIKQANAGEGLTTNVGFQSPNSPMDLAGLDPLPASGGVGAQDPAAGGDIEGEDQVLDREIASGNVWESGQSRRAAPTPSDLDEQTSGGGGSLW